MRLQKHLLSTLAIAAIASCGPLASAGNSTATVARATGTLGPAGVQRIAQLRWRTFRASAAAPTIRVSPAYTDPAGIAAHWAAFFESLVHGGELAVLDAYVAPLAEVQEICGGSDVLGCYGANHLVIPNEAAGPVAVTSIAAHEYGHHVANNRLNTPWPAIDWGTKRWATAEHVCQRVAAGAAFPGAEGADYDLNPGEALAESYRLLNETAAGLPPTWPILDPGFRPDAAALEALRQDVVNPWTAPAVSKRHVTLAAATRTWTTRVVTALDGPLHVEVRPGSYDVTLLAGDTRALLERGSWSSSGAKTVDFTVCGQRIVIVRVTRRSAARRFVLQVSAP